MSRPDNNLQDCDVNFNLRYDEIPGWVFCCKADAEWSLISSNRGMYELTGYTIDEVATKYKGKIAFLFSDMSWLSTLKEDQTQTYAVSVLQKDGGEQRVNLTIRKSIDADARICYFATMVCGATQMPQQPLVHQTATEATQLYEILPGAAFRCTNDQYGQITYANESFFTYIGYSREEFTKQFGCKSMPLIPVDEQESIKANIDAQVQEKKSFACELHICCKDHIDKWALLRGVWLEQLQEFYCLLVDITPQKQAEQKLLDTNAIFQLTTDYLQIDLWQYDHLTDTLYRSAKMFGEKVEQTVHGYMQTLKHSPDMNPEAFEKMKKMYKRVEQGEQVVSDLLLLKDKDGNVWYEKVVCISYHTENGKLMRTVGCNVNVTDEVAGQVEKQMLQIALENSQMAIWEYDIENHRIIQKKTGKERMGMDRIVENVPMSIVECGAIHGDSVEDFLTLYREVEEGKTTPYREICMHAKDGSTIWNRMALQPLFDSEGKVVRAVGWGFDITDYKTTVHRYREEQLRLYQTPDSNMIAKSLCNLTKDRIVDINITAQDIFLELPSRYTEFVELLEKRCTTSKMADQCKNKLHWHELKKRFETDKKMISFDCRCNKNNGVAGWYRFQINLYEDPVNRDLMAFVYIYDIDLMKTTGLVLERISNLDFESLGLIDVQTGKWHYVRSAEWETVEQEEDDRLYELRVADFVDQFIIPEEREEAKRVFVTKKICKRLEAESLYTVSFQAIVDGELQCKRWKFAYLDEEKTTVLVICADITDFFIEQKLQRENLKNALLQAEQGSRAKTDFLSRMSHEIRTPMNAIIGMSAIAAQHMDNRDKLAECINNVEVSAKFLLSLINDILEMSRIESGKVVAKKEEFVLSELISSINTIVREQAKQQQIEYECVDTKLLAVRYVGDAMKLQQILLNLLSNAVKFTRKGGRVQLFIKQTRAINGKIQVTFIVKDTGIGISPAFQERMFEPFEQNEKNSTSPYSGTGLGLAITKNLVDILDGKISLHSIEGIGSAFTVEFLMDTLGEFVEGECVLDQIYQDYAALVLDSNALSRKHTADCLSAIGVQTDCAGDVAQVLDYLDQMRIRRTRYQLILFDWHITDANPMQILKQVRKTVGKQTTIVVVTASQVHHIATMAKQAGGDLVVQKPLFRNDLMTILQQTKEQKNKTSNAQPHASLKGKHVLLVEDHPINIEVARQLLCAKGMIVEVAENGLVAVEAFRASEIGHFDMVLMDVRMPVMDGLVATEEIRQMNRADAMTVPIVAMSANAFDTDMIKSKEAGMNLHLAKPIEPDTLYRAIQKFF